MTVAPAPLWCRGGLRCCSQTGLPNRLNKTPADSSPPIRREIRRFAGSICLPSATRGYSPGLGDTGRAAIGRVGAYTVTLR